MLAQATALLLLAGATAAPPATVSDAVELPGFSITLPPGKVTEHSDQPQSGNHKLVLEAGPLGAPYDVLDATQLLRARLVAVSWMSTRLSHEEWTASVVEGIIATLKIPGQRILHNEDRGNGRFLSAVGTDKQVIALSYVPCGEKFSVMVMFAVSTNLEDQLRGARIAGDSIVCGKDPGGTPLHALVDLPGFSVEESADGQIHSSADGSEAVMINYTAGYILESRELFRQTVSTVLGSGLGLKKNQLKLTQVGEASRSDDVSALYRLGGLPDVDASYLSARYCAAQKVTFLIVWAGITDDQALAARRMAAVSCPAAAGAAAAK